MKSASGNFDPRLLARPGLDLARRPRRDNAPRIDDRHLVA